MMGEIYSHAWRVIICLGDDGHNGESAKIAFDVIRDYNRIAAKYMVESRIADGSWWRPKEEDGGFGPVTGDRLLHAVKIVEKPWFGRVWVFQEVGLSRDAILAYGGSTINFTEIMELIEAWGQTGNEFPGISFMSGWISGFFTHIWATFATSIDQSWYRSSFILRTSAQHVMRRNTAEFLDVLFKARRMQKATDPRDFVYAFLGHPLARSEDGELLVEADYTTTISELRLRLFSRLAERSLRFTGLTWHKFLTDLSDGPSWCPYLDCHRNWTINGRYDASRGEHLLVPVGKHRARVSGFCLEASVYIVDTVLLCGEVAGGDEDASYVPTEKMLSAQPSLAEQYWAVLEATESRNGLAYPDKALAFASTLLHSCDEDDHASIARSFGDFCREHCPIIQNYLEKYEWLDQWALETTRFIPFIPRSGSSINGERFFTTMKGYWYVRLFLDKSYGPQ
ncbi:hypothetical protein INS49_014919 [Diaporthe citri]|uniref:uncharacterized protein n=1 Tax=Diaporthe citri TaxID=83186 RepID=UPI001C7E4C74|nr:uncharacterized protein INS49_014919 [Diaporthe citri]KAG6357043.1 hypothetical protein INS49_014919 [Diaporthe citri]